MMKFRVKGQTKFGIYIATDLEDTGLTPLQIERCQYWTLAHEIGHILLHGQFMLNSMNEDDELDEHINGVLEVEAHWFASRVLMPDYLIQDAWDLDPRKLAEKCQVNIYPAQKRIEGLNPPFKRMLQGIEPKEIVEQRKQAAERAFQARYQPIWDKNAETLDRLRRHYGYE